MKRQFSLVITSYFFIKGGPYNIFFFEIGRSAMKSGIFL